EPAALARLASRHALFEVEVDDLLRKKKFVDLHRVIKESMQVAVERYSLKDLEGFAGFTRTLDLQTASEARRKLGAALNLGMLDRITDEDKYAVEEYNKDDCMATLKLHQWLEDIFQSEKDLHGFTRPGAVEGEVSEKVREREQRALDLYDALQKELPEDMESEEYKAKWLLLNSISYYRRGERMGWFEFYRLRNLQPDELIEEKGALTYLTYVETLPKKPRERNPVHRYSFIQQEVASDFTKIGTSVIETDSLFSGTIKGFDSQSRWIDISTKDENYKRTLNIQVDVSRLMNQNISLENSLHSYVSYVIANGFKGKHQCVHHLLLKQAPALANEDAFLKRKPGQDLKEYTYSILNKLDHSILPIQGPPGSGKTYLGALMIMRLVNDGKRIGICALSHSAIQNVIKKVKEHAAKDDLEIGAIHYNTRNMDVPDDYDVVSDKKKAVQEVKNGKLTGGTVYFWASDAVEQQLDYLFIDEAGQLSLNQIISASKSTKNLVLLGDPQQLEQPQQGAHPENSDISGLDHLLGSEDTIAPNKGIFLDTTRRLPESISLFTSTLYYDGKLLSHPDTSNQNLVGSEQFQQPGLYYVPVSHEGNQNKSVEEIEVVAEIVRQLLKEKCTWTDRYRKPHPLTNEDFRVIAPYNVQVDALKERLPDIQVGTVDKFQGREAPVVIYSMTSSSSEDAPRGMGFLYDPHRMNVATSRAQCLSILVANQKLFEPECHSIDQMRMANGMCSYREMATEVDNYLK
ncbi:MAG: AAA domain-containing protein, partial [Cyclobacteriaceae bacterium]